MLADLGLPHFGKPKKLAQSAAAPQERKVRKTIVQVQLQTTGLDQVDDVCDVVNVHVFNIVIVPVKPFKA
jgi:hypothetical protein